MHNASSRIVDDTTDVDIFFATNREPIDNGDYGSDLGQGLTLGVYTLRVPTDRAVGSSRRVETTGYSVLEANDFYSALRCQEAPTTLVFVHGFNVRFRDMIWRAAQMKNDLQFRGAMVVFSWPSGCDPIWYLRDQEVLGNSIDHCVEFFSKVVSEGPPESDTHIIAHSLGSRGVISAIQTMSRETSHRIFGHVVLAAPDVNSEFFRKSAHLVSAMAKTVTLYVSSNDSALRMAQELHRSPRAGDCRGPDGILIVPDVTTIDVSALNTEFFGHSYISSNRDVLSDLNRLLSGEPVPRFGMIPEHFKGGRYWRFTRR